MSVIDNPARQRFEYVVDGRTAFVDYRRAEGVITLTHAKVPPELEGHGIGSLLARGTLDLLRASGDKVIPACSFIAAFIRRNPDYRDMLA